jgi:ABC-type sugar transport system permease subunit
MFREVKTMLGAAAAIAFAAVVIPFFSSRQMRGELDEVRGARVALEAERAAADHFRAEGALTVVKETASAKYPFLNKRRYVINTSSTAREGTALRGGDPSDKARADRHAEVLRKRLIKARLEDGSWRATILAGGGPRSQGGEGARANERISVELVASPAEIEPPSPWGASLAAVMLGFAVFLVLRLRFPAGSAAAGGVLAAGFVAAIFDEVLAANAATLATISLSGAAPGGSAVAISRAGVRAIAGFVTAVDLFAVLSLFSERGRRVLREIEAQRFAYGAIAPALVGLGVLVGLPFAVGIGMSLFEHEHGSFTFVGLANFAAILRPPDRPIFSPGSMLYALFTNVVWTASNVLLHVAVGLLFALLLEKHARSWARFYRVVLIIPWAVPAYLTALIWKSMFDPDVGAVNRLLGLEGMSWMHAAPTAFLANLSTNVWLGFPFMMVVCLGALTSIPKDLYEAADVDGASGWQQFVRITVPLLKPALLPAVILGSIWTFNRFEVIYLVSEGRPDGATDILVTEAYRWAFERGLDKGGAYGFAAAYSVVIFCVLLLYGWMTSRVAKAAEEALR